jgi:catechol 2,3-dioxygenase-like lactoylglutathione lyase family enzyme
LWAQVYPPNEMGVSFGQWYAIAKDVEATKKFWLILGGTPIKIDGIDVIKYPGILVFLKQGTPSGGSVGTGLNHVGFGVANVPDSVAKWQAAGMKIDRIGTSPLNGKHTGHMDTPDGIELEITEESGADPYPMLPPNISIESNHIHFSYGPITDGLGRKVMQDWYVKNFGAKPRTLGQELTGAIPGVRFMRFGFPSVPLVPTKGRALDHIGFEVKNLQAFCKQLEAGGVKLDEPYSKTRHKSFASAGLTDPWGVSIELTEGLNRF